MNSENISLAHQQLQTLRKNLAKVVVGQDEVVHQTLVCLVAAGHGLLEGVPGLGKTLLVKALAKSTNGEFKRLQFTPDLMPSDITGHTLFDMQHQQWKIRRGPIFCNFLLADEVNRAPAKTQSALLEVMQEQQVSIEGTSYPISLPYLVLATQNSIEQEGTYPLPEAQLDRFLLKINMDYPSEAEEIQMLRLVTEGSSGDQLNIEQVQACLSNAQILEIQKTAANMQVDAQLMDYAVKITRATRNWSTIAVGAGPRGSISLIRAARAHALLNNNYFVTPDDIKKMVLPVLRHRIQLSVDYAIEGFSTDHVLKDVLASIPAPRI